MTKLCCFDQGNFPFQRSSVMQNGL